MKYDLNGKSISELKMLAQGLPGGFFIYRADADEKLIYANLFMAKMLGCDTVEEMLAYAGGTLRGIVYPDDYQSVKQDIDAQIKSNDGHYDYLEYRIKRRDGRICQVLNFGHLIRDDEEGEVYYVFAINADEMHSLHMKKTQVNPETYEYLDAIRVLGSTYNYVYKVDRKNKHLKILHGDSEKVGVAQALASSHPYELAVEAYIKKNVYFDDRRTMIQALDYADLCHQLDLRGVVRQNYRVFRDNEIHYYSMKAVKDGERYIVLRFSCEDDEIAAQEPKRMGLNDSGKRRILVVDDNVFTRELLRDILKEEYEMLEAENGIAGLRQLEEHCHDLSMVLLDVHMPQMDGFEFLEQVSRDPILSAVPVVVMTSDRDAGAEEKCIKLGAVEFLEKPFNESVMMSRIRNIVHIRENAASMHQVEYDEQTGLYTRQAFYHYATQLLKKDKNTSYTLVMIDVDDFKLINLIHGDTTGNRVLRYIADVMRKYTRKVNGILAHYGADRFVALIETADLPSEQKLEELVHKLCAGSPVDDMVARFGVYEDVDRTLPISRLCDRSASALKTVKNDYNRHVGYYDDALSDRHQREREMEANFEQSLGRGEFVPWFQPKFDPLSGHIVGAQALVRWQKPDGSMISPAAFVPLYEKDGLIARLDEYIFRCVCRMQAEYMQAGKKLIPISVNMSRNTLYHPGTLENYRAIVDEYGIPTSCVPVQITESSALQGFQIKDMMSRLKEAGFVLHMDDFGSGDSSLTSLGQMPFDVIKLDKSLTDNLCTEKGRTIIRFTIQVMHELGMQAVTEGVETAEQAQFLREQHCDAIQGYYYAKPLERSVFEKMLEQDRKGQK